MTGRRVLMVEEGGFGGIGDYTVRLSRALAEQGWVPTLATATDHPHGSVPGVRVWRVFAYVRERGPISRALRRYGLARVLAGVLHGLGILLVTPAVARARLVHSQGGEYPPLVLVQHALWRAVGARIVHTPHNSFDRTGGRREWFKQWSERLAHVVIVHAHADLPRLHPAVRRRAVVIAHGEYGGLAATGGGAERDVERARLGIAQDAVVALLFGQLRRDKGIAVLLAAACDIEELHVVLAGADVDALEHVADLLADPRLAGRVTVDEGFHSMEVAARYYAAADVAVLPYERASASGVLLLSYGFGCPPVVFPVGGLPEAVRAGETGWVCAQATEQALRDTLREVVATDLSERRRRGAAGRAMAATEYAWDRVARRTIDEAYDPASSARGRSSTVSP